MAEKARHAFGQSSGVEAALAAGKIDAYDILFLDGDTEPKVGWIDKNGVFRLAVGEAQIVRVDEIPTQEGKDNVIYICNNECYVWDGSQYVSTSKSADVSELESQINDLSAQLENKVDAETVQSMIQEGADEVIEF